MSTKLSLHWRPTHWDGRDQAIIAGWQPNSAKIINPSPDHVQLVRSVSPQTLVVLRDHPLSEQHEDMFRDPVGTGRYHAQRLAEIVAEMGANPLNTVVTGINEPRIWDPGGIEATVTYTVELLDSLLYYGLTGGALNLSVGWPANNGYNTPPDWEPFAPIYDAIKRGCHFLVLHEYWAKEGPERNWGWWAGRFTQCPWDLPIIIGECGMDQYVNGPVATESRGWQSYMSAEDYFDQLRRYDECLMDDDRIHSAEVFLYDYDDPWQTFDIRQVREQWLQFVQGLGGGDPALAWQTVSRFWNGCTTPEPPEDEFDEEAIRNAAWQQVGIPYNPDAAFAQYARAEQLGNPVTAEYDVDSYRAQGYSGGIVYAKIGDWANCDWIEW